VVGAVLVASLFVGGIGIGIANYQKESRQTEQTQETQTQRELIERYLTMEKNGVFTDIPYESPLIGANWQPSRQITRSTNEPFTITTTAFAQENASPIDLVAITVNLPPDPDFVESGLQNKDAWRILQVFEAKPDKLYTLTVDPEALGGIPSSNELIFGVDIVNKDHQRKESPNGTLHVDFDLPNTGNALSSHKQNRIWDIAAGAGFVTSRPESS
jgi:hypothetical protein